jgi:hypothetical protein
MFCNDKNNITTSYLMYRGSIPLQWSQQPSLFDIKPHVNIIKTNNNNNTKCKRFETHMKELSIRSNGGTGNNNNTIIRIFNLLSTRTHEKALANAYYSAFLAHNNNNDNNSSFLEYVHFDTKHTKWKTLYADVLQYAGADSYSKENITCCCSTINNDDHCSTQIQKVCLRINCLDTADRTSLAGLQVGLKVFEQQLQIIHSCNNNQDYSALYRHLWQDQADAISVLYTGSNALFSTVAREGKGDKGGVLMRMRDAFHALTRFSMALSWWSGGNSKKQDTDNILAHRQVFEASPSNHPLFLLQIKHTVILLSCFASITTLASTLLFPPLFPSSWFTHNNYENVKRSFIAITVLFGSKYLTRNVSWFKPAPGVFTSP